MSRRTPFVALALLLPLGLAQAKRPRDDKDREEIAPPRMMKMVAPSYHFSADAIGATPGGAKDIASARDHIMAGEVPNPQTFTPEGLFSEHDLPLPSTRPCKQVLCLSTAATTADLAAQPEVRVLAQLGFSSNLEAKTWQREPLNLVAVIDKSGSMSGEPLDTVKASLHQLIDQLGPTDQLSVVLYGDRSHVHLSPTPIRDRAALHRSIDQIASAGSTSMEEGLRVGYEVARKSAPGFHGRTRLMLFTDERPNVGATDKGSFMTMARDASRGGVGLTTIGVGTHFGAELATAISSVRGGNLFFFPRVADMKAKFQKDFDTLVTELAFDLNLKVKPSPGYRMVGIYGLPGDLLKRTPDGGVEMTVETLFLSRERGGIFFAFAPEAGALPPQGPVASASAAYHGTDGRPYQDQVSFALVSGALPLGLARGRLLVDEITTLKQATELHLHKNDQEGAYRLVHGLRGRLAQHPELGLERELSTVAKLDETLTRLSGHKGEPHATRDPVSGLPR